MIAKIKKLAHVIFMGGANFYSGRRIQAFWVAWSFIFAISAAIAHQFIVLAVQIAIGVVNFGFLYAKAEQIPGPKGDPGPQGAPGYGLTRKRLQQCSARMSVLSESLAKNPTPTEMVIAIDELRDIFDELQGRKP